MLNVLNPPLVTIRVGQPVAELKGKSPDADTKRESWEKGAVREDVANETQRHVAYVFDTAGQESTLAPYLAAGFVILFTPILFPLAVFTYRVIRPQEKIGEIYERNLAEEALWLGGLVATLMPEEPEALGLLAPGGTLYGFSETGQVVSINRTTGRGTLVSTQAAEFWGAGVTTA